ncbi:MAG: hypothetical protein Q8L79_19570 [Methylobacter sp.]|nr:hypothetical protein [Methylobacter sp.]
MTRIKKAFGKVNIHFPFEKEGGLNSYNHLSQAKKLEHRINAFWQEHRVGRYLGRLEPDTFAQCQAAG